MMPSGDGINLIDYIKRNSNSPVIMLTAMGENQNKIDGLKIELMIIFLNLLNQRSYF